MRRSNLYNYAANQVCYVEEDIAPLWKKTTQGAGCAFTEIFTSLVRQKYIAIGDSV